jgi:hypothetical protein
MIGREGAAISPVATLLRPPFGCFDVVVNVVLQAVDGYVTS